MNVLSQVLYTFQIPAGFFLTLQSIIAHFFWKGHCTRISRNILYHPKRRRDWTYQILIYTIKQLIMTRMTNWKYAKKTKLWVELETALADIDLPVVPWIP